MSKWFFVLSAGVLLQACGASPESTDVEQGELRAGPGAAGTLVCCREKFRAGPRRGLCMAEAARGQGPCASGHHPGGGGPGCKDAGAEKDAAADAGQDAGNHCPSVVSVSVSPETTPTATKFDLSYAVDANGAPGPIAFSWHLVGASVGTLQTDPATQDATFVCTSLGTQTVELTITGGDPAATCASSASLAVDCTTLCGNGTVDPGETCDPPDGTTCDATCNVLNHCPTLAPLDAAITSVNNGTGTVVRANASDPDRGDTLSYTWIATAGSVLEDYLPSTSAIDYICSELGVQTVAVTVSDGHCSVTGSIDISCNPWCGDGVVEPGEECDPPLSDVCSATCQNVPPPPPPICGNGVIEPGETCDPPNGVTCDQTCQSIPAVCGNGVQELGESCDLGPTNPVMCRNCQLTNCGGCFGAVGGSTVCSGLGVQDTQACNALVTCAANNMGWCGSSTGAACYCKEAATSPPPYCTTGGDGPCVSQFQALAHSNDPTVVLAQINDPTTPVGKVAAAVHLFANWACGPACFVYNN